MAKAKKQPSRGKWALIMVGAAMLASPAFADPWKDESGKGRWSGGSDRGYYRSYNYDREHKQEYRQGNCKIERKWERDGGYKEETKCKGYRAAASGSSAVSLVRNADYGGGLN